MLEAAVEDLELSLDGAELTRCQRLFDRLSAKEVRSAAERRAEALVNLCRFFLERHDQPQGSRHRPHLNVIVDVENLLGGAGAEFADGIPLDGSALGALACDSVLHRVLMAGRSVILDYGAGTRSVSANLFNALVVRDHHCRFPGCDRQASWCEAHHVVHMADGGPTCPSNLVLVCSHHHHRLHQPGWSAELSPDA